MGQRIDVNHENIYYGDFLAVEDVNINIEPNKVTSFIGPSGCGKSTLGRTILRLSEPNSGQIFFDGKDILKCGRKDMQNLRTDMQIIFQDPYASLNPRMNVREIISEPLTTHGLARTKDEIESQVKALMDEVGIPREFINRYPHQFSGGQRQRIGIARAIALHPRLIICDEPVSALDVSIQAQIINLLAQLQRELELTVLFISHDLRVVRHITHRVMVMYLGSNVEVGPTEAIFQHPAHPYTQVLTKAAPKLDPLNRQRDYAIEGEPPSPIHTPTGCKFHPRCPYCTDKCRSEVPELKEIAPGHYPL